MHRNYYSIKLVIMHAARISSWIEVVKTLPKKISQYRSKYSFGTEKKKVNGPTHLAWRIKKLGKKSSQLNGENKKRPGKKHHSLRWRKKNLEKVNSLG